MESGCIWLSRRKKNSQPCDLQCAEKGGAEVVAVVEKLPKAMWFVEMPDRIQAWQCIDAWDYFFGSVVLLSCVRRFGFRRYWLVARMCEKSVVCPHSHNLRSMGRSCG